MNAPAPGTPPPLPPNPAPPPRKGMTGLQVALLVGGLVLLVMIVSTLAAIALPSYNSYLVRSQVTAAVAEATPLKLYVSEFVSTHGRCPQPGDPGLDDALAASTFTGAFASLGRSDDRCTIDLVLRGDQVAIDGRQLRLVHDGAGGWRCQTDLDPKYLPPSCRG